MTNTPPPSELSNNLEPPTLTRRSGLSPLLSGLVILLVVALVSLGSFSVGISMSSLVDLPPASPSESLPDLTITECTAPSKAFEALCDVYARIHDEYVDRVDDQDLVEGAIRGMLEYGLQDPYSGYVPPEEMDSAFDQLSGSFSGIGAEVGIINLVDARDITACGQIGGDCALVVIAPIPGSPAEAAGLLAGDIITAIDGVSTEGSTVELEVTRVRGRAGTTVTLSILRDGQASDVTIERQAIELPMVSSLLLENQVGYIHLALFGDLAAPQLREALLELQSQGMTSLIFDLRNNPGGYIDAAQDVASEFIGEGLIFTQESGETLIRWTAKPGGLATSTDLPMIVLINGGSASASEIVAAALSERGRATLVGESTFGKNTVQVWSQLANGGGLRLTTDRWFTPEHRSVVGDGLQPDVLVPASTEAAVGEDPVLQRAMEILTGN